MINQFSLIQIDSIFNKIRSIGGTILEVPFVDGSLNPDGTICKTSSTMLFLASKTEIKVDSNKQLSIFVSKNNKHFIDKYPYFIPVLIDNKNSKIDLNCYPDIVFF